MALGGVFAASDRRYRQELKSAAKVPESTSGVVV